MPGRRAVLALPGALAAAPAAAQQVASLDATLRPYLARHTLPALAAAVVRQGRVVASGAVGLRRWGTTIPVTINDAFHIGSDTKAMTALLLAQLVEAGRLRWDTPMAEAFPDLAGRMTVGLGAATLTQVMSHTSGLPADNDATDKLIAQSFEQPGNLDTVRAWFVGELVRLPLTSPPGTRFSYSNSGYVMLGALVERLTGRTWEEVVVERIFTPFGLRTAGFGPAASMGRVDATLGHIPGSPPKPMLAGPNGDNPLLIGPAGTVHLSVLDFARWAGWNAGLARRAPALVRPETLQRLQAPIVDITRPDAPPGTPPTGRYGLGWGWVRLPVSTEPFQFHAGSNEMNLAFIVLQPRFDFAMVAMTNIGGTEADTGLKALVTELYRRFGPAPA